MKNKIKFATWSFAFVLFTNLYYFYLIDRIEVKLSGIEAKDIALGLAVLWGVFYWIRMIKLPNPKFRFRFWMLLFLAMVLLSSLQSYWLYGQSIFRGIAPQRWVFIWALVYFPLRKCIYHNKIELKDIMRILVVFGVIQLVLFTLQFFLGDGVLLLHVGRGIRNGRTRYYYNPIFLDFLLLLSLDGIVKGDRLRKILYGFLAGWVLFEVMMVQQFRATTCGLIVCLGLFMIIMIQQAKHKLVYCIIGCIALIFLISTPVVQSAVKQVVTNSFDAGMRIRSVGRQVYMQALKRHPVLGGGYPSTYHEQAMQAVTGGNPAVYLVDNGVFALVYLYGGIGLVWIVTLWGKLIQNGNQIRKRSSEAAYFLFPLFCMVVLTNEIHWYWDYGFVFFAIFLCTEEKKMDMLDIKSELIYFNKWMSSAGSRLRKIYEKRNEIQN